jgi:ABC-type bacteriocin/lantibiotic exporter with double-glycine peptidase domain
VLLSGEATSAFDRGMEDEVKHDIDARLKMRRTPIVTHRVETIRDCRISFGSTANAFGD